VIGKGCFGKIVLAEKEDTGQQFAMKVFNKTSILQMRQVDHTKAERRILSSVDPEVCSFIVSLHSAFQTSSKLYLVLGYVPGGDLYFHLSQWRRFPEQLAKFLLAEVVCALEYLHSLEVVYRDLKPENIILDDTGHVKLVDFGLAKEGVSSRLSGANSFCGTPEYLSPEVLDRKGHGTAVDIWGLGMVLYEFLTGLPPWYKRNGTREELFQDLRYSKLVVPEGASEQAVSLLQGLLEKEPSKRIGFNGQGMMEVQMHPFFIGMNWEQLKRREVAPPLDPRLPRAAVALEKQEKHLARLPVESASSKEQTDIQDDAFSGFDTPKKRTAAAPPLSPPLSP
jgi:serum/glucocorticoid-regulated kinase 2